VPVVEEEVEEVDKSTEAAGAAAPAV